jgi:cytochrome c biogenesis protein
MKVGEKTALEGEGLEITVLHFIPDFVINDKDEIATRSLEPNNPAAFIEGWKKEEKIFSGWLFAKFPDFSRIHSIQETDLSFELKDFKAGQFSVIQASKDPGVNIIWVGCAVLMAGLILALYWPTREIKVVLEGRDSQTEISAGGIASKSHDAFKSEFQEIMTSIRRIE